MKTNKETLILAQQDETHIYAGDTGFIVVRQVRDHDEDSVVFIDPVHIETVIAALKNAAPIALKNFAEWVTEDEE